MGDGKLLDVLVEFHKRRDSTGIEEFAYFLDIWADPGMEDVIKAVSGVTKTFNHNDEPTEYTAFIDHRYDIEHVAKEIEAAILCASPYQNAEESDD